MSINQAFGNAFSGLSAASRASEIVSRNIANASTEGYSATGLSRVQQVNGLQGAGVRISGVERAGNPLVTADRRRSDAAAGHSTAQAETQRTLSDLIADPDGGDSLSTRFTAFENALRALADTPESAASQGTVAAAGRALATRFNTLSTEAQRLRGETETDIRRQVETVNAALKKIAQLNTSIAAAAASGQDTTALEDERDRQIEVVNGIVPIRTRNRDEGGMVVASAGGTLLLEGSAREVVLNAGTVPWSLSVDGNPTPATGGPLAGGTLDAAMTALAETIPAFERQVDALAIDLIQRFQDLPGYRTQSNAPDPPDLTGLFVIQTGVTQTRLPEMGKPPSTADLAALDAALGGASVASAIRLNAKVDPAQGGDAALLWRRTPPDGMIERDTGETFATALMTAMRAKTTSGISGLSGSFNATDMAIGLTSVREVAAAEREGEASFRRAATLSLREKEQAGSAVDTDAELRNLLRIEQAYAANARMLQAIKEMTDMLREI